MAKVDSFSPKYAVTPKLLDLLKKIAAHAAVLNTRQFPRVVLAEFERHARENSAFSSTSIEGNPLPLTEVKRILKNLPPNISNSQKEVLNYNEALIYLDQHIAQRKDLRLDLPLVLHIHRVIVKGLLPKGQSGVLRSEAVFVNDPRLRKTIYWPPDHADVAILMRELLEFVKRNISVLDPIILAGIFHKQFVIVHPFLDGNGRTVRLATKVLLAGMGLNTFKLFSFENYYNRNVTRYFSSVGVIGNYYDLVDKVDFTLWLEYFAEGILDELYRVSKELDAATIDPSLELKDHHKVLLREIGHKGYITDREYARLTSRAKPTRALDFNKLIALGYIERFGRGRSTHYKLKREQE